MIQPLRELGHDVTAISRHYPPGLADEDVLTIALEEARVLIVADRDFGELIFHQELAHADVIFFRLPGAILQTKIEQFCAARGIAVTEWVSEIGGGLNFRRPRFVALIDTIVAQQVAMVVIAHKDRLMRFGFDLFAHLCRRHQCELVVMNTETLSPEQEMVQDLMTITHCFSARLYGLRNYRKALDRALKEPAS